MTPLPILAVVLVLGVIAAQVTSPEPWTALAAALMSCLVYGVTIAQGRRTPAALAALGAAWSIGWAAAADPRWAEPTYKPADHVLQGRVEELRPTRDQRLRLRLRLEGAAVVGKDGYASPLHPAFSQIWLWLDRDDARGARRGDRVVLRARAPRADRTRNLGDGRDRLTSPARSGLVSGPLLIERGPAWRWVVERVRGHLRRRIEATVDPPARGLVLALALGDRSGLGGRDLRAFRRSGTAHLLAVSGLHVSLVGGLVYWLALALLLRTPLARRFHVARPAALAGLLACWSYALLTGLAPPAFRAAVMATSALLALVVGRASRTSRALCLAAVVLLLHDPELLWRASFQLSFAAVLALTGLKGLSGRASTVSEQLGRWRRWGRSLLFGLGNGALTSLVATGATAPLLAHHFGQVSAWGIAVNVVAVPLTAVLILPATLLHTLVCGASVSAGRLTAWVAEGVLSTFLAALRWVSDLPALIPSLARPNLIEAISMSAAVLLLARRRARRWGAVLLVAAATVWCARVELPTVRRELQVTFIDVGAGDATLIRFPNGERWLIDAGPSAGSPGWPPDVVAVAQRSGFGRLDRLVLTHGHLDHAAGMPAVLERIGAVRYWSPLPGAGGGVDPIAPQALSRGAEVIRAPEMCGLRRGPVRIEVLHPCRPGDGALSENDRSLVVRLVYGEVSVLLPGDIERVAEESLVRRISDLSATVLKLPHHGSETSSSEALLEAVRPRVAIASCARSRRRPLPHPTVAERLYRRNVIVLSTAELGAIRLTTDGRRLELEAARTGRLR